MLVAISYGLYCSVWGIVLGMDRVVAAGTSPMLYEPDLAELLEFLVVPVPLNLTVALVCNYVSRRPSARSRRGCPRRPAAPGARGAAAARG